MLEYLNRLVQYLSEEITEVAVKGSPQALWAPQSYDLLNYSGIVLVWIDSVPSYVDKSLKLEPGDTLPHKFIQNIRIVISVGLRTMVDAPDLDLLVEKVSNKLIHLKIGDYSGLRPISISKINVDANSVYWRQLHFETSKQILVEPVILAL